MKNMSLPVRAILLTLMCIVIANAVYFILDSLITHDPFEFRPLTGLVIPAIIGVTSAISMDKNK